MIFKHEILVTDLGDGRKSIMFQVYSSYKLIVKLAIFVFRFKTIYRETYWRRKPEIFRDNDFISNNTIEYCGSMGFIIGKLFGKTYLPKKFDEDVSVYKL